MDDDAQPVDLQSLGVDGRGISAEAILDADGNVTIQNADGDELTLDGEQVQTLVVFLVRQMKLSVPQ